MILTMTAPLIVMMIPMIPMTQILRLRLVAATLMAMGALNLTAKEVLAILSIRTSLVLTPEVLQVVILPTVCSRIPPTSTPDRHPAITPNTNLNRTPLEKLKMMIRMMKQMTGRPNMTRMMTQERIFWKASRTEPRTEIGSKA